jgi:hypothetical protein
MTSSLNSLAVRTLSALVCGSALVACGGGTQSAAPATQSASGASTSQQAAMTVSTSATRASTTTTATTAAATSAAITDVRFENTDTLNAQTNVPVTFGQVFAQGDLQPGDVLSGRLDDGSAVPLQLDIKASHPDGSVRHAVISAVLPSLAAGAVRTVTLVKGGTPPALYPVTVDSALNAGFTASVHALINGVDYSASADQLLKSIAHKTWLYGGVVNEWQVSAPLTTADGVQHPHLSARFAVRWYDSVKKARVDVTVENDWAYEPAPQNFTYDAQVMVGGNSVYTKAAMTHLHHARWRKVFWWGGDASAINVKHNTGYLIASRALPNFDQTITVPETALAALKTKWTGAITEPMAVGMANPYMPTTGGRPDIGLLPGWAAQYLLSMDKRARDVTLGTADLAGSWSAHYRDRKTDRPISLLDYPYMTVLGQRTDTYNPTTKQYEAFPACAAAGACSSPNLNDSSHQPAFAYLPYLVTGDYYYLEELQFWAMWNSFASNPGYRQHEKGLYQSDQIRAQAWSMRTIAEAAYITPDRDSLKAAFNSILSSNLDWYNTTYSNNASTNALGALTNGYALGYSSGTGLAPWQDDFFTSAIGHVAELGFSKASALLAWKAKFPILRMVADGACWVDGAKYSMIIRDSSTSPFYTTMAQVYKANHTDTFTSLTCGSAAMGTALGLKAGEMTGYSGVATGYPSNMQPALAYAADAGGADGKNAWSVFMARSVKPNYSAEPQFDIVPR